MTTYQRIDRNIKDTIYSLTQPHQHRGYSFQIVETKPSEECLTGENVYIVVEPLKKQGAYKNYYAPPYIHKLRLHVWSGSAALSDEILNEVLRRLSFCGRYWQSRELIANPAKLDDSSRAWISVGTIDAISI